MTDVETPTGKRYRVQIRPQSPSQRDPLAAAGDIGDLLLPAVIGGALSPAARKLNLAVVRPGDRWTIEVIRRETTWRSGKVVHAEIIDTPNLVIDRAFELADFIRRGISRLAW